MRDEEEDVNLPLIFPTRTQTKAELEKIARAGGFATPMILVKVLCWHLDDEGEKTYPTYVEFDNTDWDLIIEKGWLLGIAVDGEGTDAIVLLESGEIINRRISKVRGIMGERFDEQS